MKMGPDINDTLGQLIGASVNTGDGNDRVVGGDGDDTIDTGAGNDQIIDLAGNNVIDAGDGNNNPVYALSPGQPRGGFQVAPGTTYVIEVQGLDATAVDYRIDLNFAAVAP